MIRRKKALPGTTTMQVKLSSPIKDCNSFNVTFLRFKKVFNNSRNRSNLSIGNRISILLESNSRPRNVSIVVGNTVFSSFIGKPNLLEKSKIYT